MVVVGGLHQEWGQKLYQGAARGEDIIQPIAVNPKWKFCNIFQFCRGKLIKLYWINFFYKKYWAKLQK